MDRELGRELNIYFVFCALKIAWLSHSYVQNETNWKILVREIRAFGRGASSDSAG